MATYSARIESLQTLILEQETAGKSAETASALEGSLKAQTIQVFFEGLGSLKDFIKARNPSTLDKAIQAACEEERVRKSMEESKRFYENPNKQSATQNNKTKPNTPCFHYGKMGHWARDCRSPEPRFPKSYAGTSTRGPSPANGRTIMCNCCRKPGHTKEVCCKLKYVNSKKGTGHSQNNAKQRETPNSRTTTVVVRLGVSKPPQYHSKNLNREIQTET